MELEMPEMRLVGVVGFFCCHTVVLQALLVLALEEQEVTVR
jgi:hypothetical protein